MEKNKIPFSRLYSCISPEDFMFLFKGETPQTMAFILSFCPRRSFVKKLVHLIETKEKKDGAWESRSGPIREYLSKCHSNSYDKDIINIVEEQIAIMTVGYKNYSSAKKFRKRFF